MSDVVTTTTGAVRGMPAADGWVYRGIPFAAPPTGVRRFRPPSAPLRWRGIREVGRSGAVCPGVALSEPGVLHELGADEPSDEDCLFVNVWTPCTGMPPDGVGWPTLVWFHGGGFVEGSGTKPVYDGSAFSRDGVVLVTCNYRLHAFGFLYLDEDFPGARGTGNLGLLDQIAALRWVRANIAAFGGDPGNVTIGGDSAGAHCVGALLATPGARGLFGRALLQSGAGHAALPRAAARRVTRAVLDGLAVRPGDWEGLQAVPTVRIVEAARCALAGQATELLGGGEVSAGLAFAPVVDGCVLADRPDRAIAQGSARGIAVLAGTTQDEMRLFAWGLPGHGRFGFGERPAGLIPPGSEGREVLAAYREARAVDDDADRHVATWTDALFTMPALRLVEAQGRHEPRTWLYRFRWPTPVLDGRLRACHTLDLPFAFDVRTCRDLVGDAPPSALFEAVHGSWVRFVSTGDPGPVGDLAWPRYDCHDRSVMIFDDPCRVELDPEPRIRRSWDGLV